MNTESYWIKSAPTPSFPQPTGDVEVDVLVVGGGIMGITAAYLAKLAGRSVALIDRARVATMDTGHTTAHLTAVVDTRFHELQRRFGKDAARGVWDAGMSAIDQIVGLIRREGIECDFTWAPGYLHAPVRTVDPKGVNDLEKEADALRGLDIKATPMPEVPFFRVPGIRFPHQALFHPRKYLRALLAVIPGEGSHVFEQTNAEEFTDDPRGVVCSGKRIRAKYVILATHTPLMGNTGMMSAMAFQTKLSLYSSYAVAGKIPKSQHAPASFWDTSDPYDYLRIEARGDHGYAILGGEDHKTGQVSDTEPRYRSLEQRLRQYFPGVTIDHRWSGQVIETNDGLPFIGETAEHQFAATGFAGNGMTFGTLGAMMAVDQLLGRKNPWGDLFDIHRKKRVGGLWTYLAENKDYPYYMLRDRLARADDKSYDAVENGEGKILSIDGKKIAAYRGLDGKLALCSPVCTHLKCIVDWNTAEKTWDCPCHGSRFTPDGSVISGPAEEPLERLPLPDHPANLGKSNNGK